MRWRPPCSTAAACSRPGDGSCRPPSRASCRRRRLRLYSRRWLRPIAVRRAAAVSPPDHAGRKGRRGSDDTGRVTTAAAAGGARAAVRPVAGRHRELWAARGMRVTISSCVRASRPLMSLNLQRGSAAGGALCHSAWSGLPSISCPRATRRPHACSHGPAFQHAGVTSGGKMRRRASVARCAVASALCGASAMRSYLPETTTCVASCARRQARQRWQRVMMRRGRKGGTRVQGELLDAGRDAARRGRLMRSRENKNALN